MDQKIFVIIAIAAGLLLGYITQIIFDHLPESWLQDYDYDEKSPDFRLSKRMTFVPHGIISMAFCAIMYLCSVIFAFQYAESSEWIRYVIILVMAPVLMIIMMSDRLNRIIPDQATYAIALLGILAIVADALYGNIWFSENAAWYIPVLNRVIAAIVGGGLLWLIGFLTVTFTGKEGMGQGDMKLLAASGLLTGCYGLVVTFYVAIFSALIIAIPLYIHKRQRIAKEKEYIKNSPDPVKARRELRAQKAKIHFAEDPDYLAFGPFLAFGAGVFIVLEPFFYEHLIEIIKRFGVYF